MKTHKIINHLFCCLGLLFGLQLAADAGTNTYLPTNPSLETFQVLREGGDGDGGGTETVYLTPYGGDNPAPPIDQSRPVGRTIGSHAVTPTGGASYTIPIPLPPGTNGLVPSIALAYNSMGGNRILGMGWSVTGLSSISRGNRNIFHDGEIETMQFLKDDAYYLNGNRLMLMSGTYGDPGSVYGGEIEDFSIITAIGSGINGPRSFRVETKEGLTYEYGSSANSRHTHSTGVTLSWSLSKIKDCNGNYIEFKYKIANNAFLLDEILYTGNSSAGLTPYNSIKFGYGNRLDNNILYSKGDGFNQVHLLNDITINGENSQLFKKFLFNYAFVEGHSLLRELTEMGTDGSTLNSTKFEYGQVPQDVSFETTSAGQGNGKDVFTGDYNGDGRTDLLLAGYAYNNGFRYNTDIEIYYRNSNNNGFNLAYNVPIYASIEPGHPSIQNLPVADYNGDGLSDLMAANVNPHPSFSNYYYIDFFNRVDANYSGTGALSNTVIPSPSPYSIFNINHQYYSAGDFDGDGKGDYLLFLSDFFNYKAFISLEGGDNPNNEIIIQGSFTAQDWAEADKLRVIDFNGDGKQELMVVINSNTKIYTFKKVMGQYYAYVLYDSGFPTQWHDVYTGDFNGDGKTDLLTHVSSNWYLEYSNGISFTAGSFTPVTPIHFTGNHRVLVSDFNGDGKSDILYTYYNTNTSAVTLNIYYSRGNSFDFEEIHTSITSLGAGVALGDFNGDGRSDLIQQTLFSSPMDIFLFKPFGTERLLEKITDGYGLTTEFNYKPLTEGGGFYIKDAEKPYPMIKVAPPIYTVDEVTVPDGIGGLFTTNYTYIGAHLHRQGRGFLGFERIISENNVNINKSVEDYTFNTTYYYPAKGKHTVLHNTTNDNIYVTIPSTNFNSLSNNRFWISITELEELDYPRDAKNLHAMEYDSYGNLLSKQSQLGWPITGTGIYQEHVSEEYSNYVALCGGNIAFPEVVSITNERTGEASVSKTTVHSYNSNGLFRSIEYANTTNPVQMEHTQFDIFGNIEETQISSPGLLTRITKNTYDSKGRFSLAFENELGQTENRTYHPLWGKAEEVIAVDGLIAQQTYDPFGRVATITDALNHTTQLSWVWDAQTGSGVGGTSVNNAIYHKELDIPGSPNQEVYYDIYDRERMTQTEGYNGQTVHEVTSYDEQGRVKTTSTPFYNAASAIVTTSTYDDYNRPVNISNGVSSTSYSYSSGNGQLTTVTTLPNSSTKTTIVDAVGKTLSSTDNGGTLYFTYDSFGNTTEVSDGSIAISSMVYDSYGRQESLTNVDAGTSEYDYDAYGQLISQTDANGNAHSMQYDVMGRLISKQGTEGTTTYDYVVGGNGLNQLEKMTGFNGIEKEYTYDSYGRLEKLDVPYAQGFSCQFFYDTFGRNHKKIYSSGVDVSKQFDGNGYLLKILSVDNGVLVDIYEPSDMDAFGHHTKYTLGNGIESDHTYNHYGYPTRYNTNGGLQDLQLDWNMTTGNLNQRTDHIKSLSESFTYDNMDRLTNSTSALAPQVQTTYDLDGSINFNDPAGVYQPWATVNNRVRKISNPTTNISLTTQQIEYTTFNEPDKIIEGDEMNFVYGPDYRRIHSALTDVQSNPIILRWYVPEANYEIEYSQGTYNHIHYIRAGGKLVAMLVKEDGSTQTDYYYTYTDHLGSILTVTDDNATVIAEQSFDAWGRRRDPSTWQYVASLTANPKWLFRGYTGHEQLDHFELVHMNGRLYAPKTGMMLSPDNFVLEHYNTQSHNRYIYVYNNPLKYTDPNGEAPLLAAVAIAFAVGGTTNAILNADKIDSFGKGALYFAVGGIGAAAGVALPPASAPIKTGLLIGGLSTGALNVGADYATGNLNENSNFGDIVASFRKGVIAGGVGTAIGNIALHTTLQFGQGIFKESFFEALKPYQDLVKEVLAPKGEGFRIKSGLTSGTIRLFFNAEKVEGLKDGSAVFARGFIGSFVSNTIDYKLLNAEKISGVAVHGLSSLGAGLSTSLIFERDNLLQSTVTNSAGAFLFRKGTSIFGNVDFNTLNKQDLIPYLKMF